MLEVREIKKEKETDSYSGFKSCDIKENIRETNTYSFAIVRYLKRGQKMVNR